MNATKRQAELLGILRAEAAAGRPVPTYVEMGRLMGLRSLSNVNRLVVALEQRGLIRRIRRCARSIVVSPEGGGRARSWSLCPRSRTRRPWNVRRPPGCRSPNTSPA